jgi:hypothetical protein
MSTGVDEMILPRAPESIICLAYEYSLNQPCQQVSGGWNGAEL